MEVALELAALFVGGSHEACPRAFEVSDRLLPSGVELGVLGSEQRDGTRRVEQLGVVVELSVVHDGDSWASVVLDHRHLAPGACLDGRTLVIGSCGTVRKNLQLELRIAERPAQHHLELLIGGVVQRLHDQSLHRARGEQLGGDQREQEAVPDARASGDEHPDDDAVQLRVFGREDPQQLIHDLAQQEQQGDGRADGQGAPPRRRAGDEAMDHQGRDHQCKGEDGVPEQLEHVERQRRVRRDGELVARTQRPAAGDRAARADLRQQELDRRGRQEHRDDTDDQHDLRRPVQAPGREGQDEHVGGEPEDLLPEQADREQPAIAGRLEDVERADDPPADQQRAERALRALPYPIHARQHRPDDEVGLLGRKPFGIAQEVRRQCHPHSHDGSRDRGNPHRDLPPDIVAPPPTGQREDPCGRSRDGVHTARTLTQPPDSIEPTRPRA